MKIVKSLAIVILIMGINISISAKDECRDQAKKDVEAARASCKAKDGDEKKNCMTEAANANKAANEECRKKAKEAKDKVNACIKKAKDEHKASEGSCKEMSSKEEQKKCRQDRREKVDNAIRACRAE